MNMIERVARAIRLRDTTDEFAMARAAIEAFREPSEEMIEAQRWVYHHEGVDNWRKGIDAALKE